MVPRERIGNFQTDFMKHYQRREIFLEDAIIALYQSGVITRKIGELVDNLILLNGYSATTISNIFETLRDDIDHRLSRPLEKELLCFIPRRFKHRCEIRYS